MRAYACLVVVQSSHAHQSMLNGYTLRMRGELPPLGSEDGSGREVANEEDYEAYEGATWGFPCFSTTCWRCPGCSAPSTAW